MSYKTNLPWPDHDDGRQLVGVYQGLEDLDPADDGLHGFTRPLLSPTRERAPGNIEFIFLTGDLMVPEGPATYLKYISTTDENGVLL